MYVLLRKEENTILEDYNLKTNLSNCIRKDPLLILYLELFSTFYKLQTSSFFVKQFSNRFCVMIIEIRC